MSTHRNDVSRRDWDVHAFENRAKERETAEKHEEKERLRARKASQNRDHIDGDPFAPTRAWLRKRDYQIDFDAKVGSTEVISTVQGGGFHCRICDVTSKDSNRFLNHINSRVHQKNLGMSMRVKRSTAVEVRQAFADAAKKKNQVHANKPEHPPEEKKF